MMPAFLSALESKSILTFDGFVIVCIYPTATVLSIWNLTQSGSRVNSLPISLVANAASTATQRSSHGIVEAVRGLTLLYIPAQIQRQFLVWRWRISGTRRIRRLQMKRCEASAVCYGWFYQSYVVWSIWVSLFATSFPSPRSKCSSALHTAR